MTADKDPSPNEPGEEEVGALFETDPEVEIDLDDWINERLVDLGRFDRADQAAVDAISTAPVPYDETTRRAVLLALGGIFVLALIAYVIAALWAPDGRWERVDYILDRAMTGVIGLAGVAIGYYFGASRT